MSPSISIASLIKAQVAQNILNRLDGVPGLLQIPTQTPDSSMVILESAKIDDDELGQIVRRNDCTKPEVWYTGIGGFNDRYMSPTEFVIRVCENRFGFEEVERQSIETIIQSNMTAGRRLAHLVAFTGAILFLPNEKNVTLETI